MAKETKLLNFKTCGNVNNITSSSILSNDSSTQKFNLVYGMTAAVPNAYASDSLLKGKVIGIGSGWQQFTLEEDATIEFMARGAVGGYCSGSGFSVNPSTGAKTGTGNIGGRGAKLKATGKFKKGTIFYITVGQRGPGYYNTSSKTITGGGGGVSAIFIQNNSGKYTFTPVNKKVDVIMIAGGGGGAGSPYSNASNSGGDASYNNGTKTTGGTGTLASSGGAGLTGNGTATGSATAISYSLLSGTPGTGSGLRMGGWPGGGTSVSGGQGAGGAGYSGGNAYGTTKPAEGGTSFINEDYVTPTFRGYATYAEDNVNPWYVNGSVTMTLIGGRDSSKCILALDTEGYKYFDGDLLEGTNATTPTYTWKLLDTQTTPEVETYETYGKSEITNTSGLVGKTRFLVMSPNAEETLEIDGNINGITVVQNTPISTSDVSLFKKFTVTGTLTNLDVRFAVSKNQGASWQTYSGGNWVDIDIKNKQDFKTNGYLLSQISSIPVEDWNSYKPATINFAFCITQNGTNTNTILNNIKATVDLVGS